MRFVLSLLTALPITMSSTIAQWSQQVNGLSDMTVTALYADTTTLYAGTSTQLFKSTDFGSTWFASSSGLPASTGFNSIVRSGSVLIAGGNAVGIWRTSNNGNTWARTTSGVNSDEYVSSFRVEGNTIYGAFGYPSSVGVSTDNGATWTKSSNGIQATQYLTDVAKIGSTLFACHAVLGVYVSTNNGINWSLAGAIGAQNKNALVASGTTLIAATSGGIPSQDAVFRSTDQGTSWTQVRSGARMFGLSRIGTTVYAVGDSLFRTTDNGLSWSSLDLSGWPGTAAWNTLQIAGTYAFVNFYGIGVYRRPTSQILGVRELPTKDLPTAFALEQNFPNPFNPTTTIEFSLHKSSHVTLNIFDLLGRVVAALVNEELNAGHFNVKWDARNIPSGTYFYQLRAGDFVANRKLVLLR